MTFMMWIVSKKQEQQQQQKTLKNWQQGKYPTKNTEKVILVFLGSIKLTPKTSFIWKGDFLLNWAGVHICKQRYICLSDSVSTAFS